MDSFENVIVDEDLVEGASNAINVCLRVLPDERVTLITDTATLEIAASLHQEIVRAGSSCNVFVLEDFGPRPHTDMPQAILEDLAGSQVSVYAVTGQRGELRTRMQMTGVVTRHRLRHAHMINIDRRIMMEGMRADYAKIDAISAQVLALGVSAREIHATSHAGTDIRATFTPDLRWLKTSGIISPEKWGNLPGGEVFTSPLTIDGTYVVDGVVGDYLCKKYGDLHDRPLTITIRNN
ncbi:MAG: aminopeptidase, partial [Ignavibacteria bacterium]|nr:aminopeptidase [Ignavibacteria bacterium]